jgi:hypothetical protein
LAKNPKSPECRFWELVTKEGPLHPLHGRCWVWIRHPTKEWYINGYKRGNIRAHRLSWIIHFDEIKDNLLVLHKCDNPSCVNPEHLFLGTHKDNSKDMVSKGRGRGWFNSMGHPFKSNPELNRGENHPNCKLTNNQVLEIINWKKGKGELQKEAAKRLGISLSHFQNIRSGNKRRTARTAKGEG